ncbi:MAG: GAF domain-containing protein [Rhizobiales bacterium]|nr:GAF domain-containing protein [Hyphomicrobiales bacterium]
MACPHASLIVQIDAVDYGDPGAQMRTNAGACEPDRGAMITTGHGASNVSGRTGDSDRERTSDVTRNSPFFPDAKLVEAALESAKIGVWSWDIASNRVIWSSNLEPARQLPANACDGGFAFVDSDVHPDDQAQIRTQIEDSLRTGQPCRMLYRLPPRADEEEQWVESLATVIVDKGGRALGMFGTCRDVTDRVRLHRELRIRASQQEAVARLGERALTETDLQTFFDDTAAMVADVLDVEFVKILEMVPGDAEFILRAGVGWKPHVVGQAHLPTIRGSQAGYTISAGRPVVVENLATETRFESPTMLHDHGVVSGLSCPIAGRDGRAYGIVGAHTTRPRKFSESDVSFLAAVANVIAGTIQRRQLDQRQELMIRELRHRSGNLFSQLLALFSQTAKNSRNLTELVPKYEARVLALANAHRLVTEGGWKSASLIELLNILLAPYLDRIAFAGPNVFLEADPTFGLSMAIHELTTNASKHGSLSTRVGRVEVTWQVQRTDLGLTLLLNWKELEGPTPKRQRRTGFGSRLVTMVIERQLNGTVRMTYAAGGLDVELTVPLTHERWPGRTIRSTLPKRT